MSQGRSRVAQWRFPVLHRARLGDFLHKGLFSCYRPVPIDTPIPPAEKQLTDVNWRQLLYLAHTDEKQAFNRYADYYLSANGQVYWSDFRQLSIYPDNYHREIDDKLHAPFPATEMITEIDVPRPALKGFLDEVREDFRKNSVPFDLRHCASYRARR